MLQCIAIDDEPLALELLEDNISKVPYLKLVASCNNPIEAMKILADNKIDLIFLDIQMPGLTGLQFIRSLAKKPMFILITAYEKYALDGFNLDVVDYLVKPVALDRFIQACGKALELFDLKNPQSNNSLPSPIQEYIFVNVDYSLLKVVLADILYIEGLKDYIKIHLKSSPNKPIIPRMGMKAIEDEIPATQFVRVHKSYIVSRDHVTAVRKNSVFIGPLEIPVSDNYRDAIAGITGKQG
ncbi:MAG: response regulator transcription factor [Chitinophagaceae bacterium]|nr:response regulator transcription factor [Chitinophagaceae bacterium]